MIFLISIALMIAFILGGIFVNFGPNVYKLMEHDVENRALANAELTCLEYGDLLLRSKQVIPPATLPATEVACPCGDTTQPNFFTNEDGKASTYIKGTIYVYPGNSLGVDVSKEYSPGP